jgi:long-chain acyl-CoA synthetase
MAATLNLAWLVEHQTRLTPDRTAVVCGEHRLTYAQLNAMADRVAVGLRRAGFGRGDHIALSCPNTLHFPIAYFGILKMGGVVVPLNVLLKSREIAYHLADSDAKALLVFEGTPELPMARFACEACDISARACRLIVITIDPAAPCPVDNAITLSTLMQAEPDGVETPAIAAETTAVILYTSGTTGQPKGAELSQLNMLMNATISRDLVLPLLHSGVSAVNVSLITLPLFHSFGQTALMNAGFAGGFTLVLLPRMDPAEVLRACAAEAVSYWAAVPTMFWTLLQHARTLDRADVQRAVAALRVCMSGGAPLSVQLLHDFEEMFGVRVMEGYGLSETSPVACFNQVLRPMKPGTVGLPVPSCEVRVVDDADRALPAGERGEIAIRGHNIMTGYYKRPVETAEALRGGWFHTGDIGVLDAEGYLSIVDRKKDLIIRGGLNVYPREVEEVLLTHPAISLAAVIGVPDERLGEEVKAFVVLKKGLSISADALVEWSKDQMAAFKYPRMFEIREALPLGPTGKLEKKQLR